VKSSSRRVSAPEGARRSRGRLAATVTVLVAALAASALPASAAVRAADTKTTPPRTVTQPRPGAKTVPLSPAQRRQLLDEAADTAPETARALKLGSREKLVPKDVVKDADGTVHTRYERTYSGLPVLGGDLVVHDRAGVLSTSFATKEKLSLPTTKAEHPATEAKKSAMGEAKAKGTAKAASDKAPRLVVWAQGGKPKLAWESVVTGVRKDGSPSELHVLTDADSGAVLNSADHVESAVGNSMYS
jgi:Zn-dependent metalloprotease